MTSKHLRWSALKVGIVVLIGLIIFVFIVSIVGTEQNVFTSTYSLNLFMPNVQGLVKGAMVTLGGLKIGYVHGMEFTQREGTNGVDVRMDVLTKYRASITTSSVAQIKTIGLLGDKYIDISIGNPGEDALMEQAFIPLRESFDIEAAGPQLKASLNDFTELMGSAKRIAASVERGEGSLGKLVKQPTVAREMERFLASLNDVMAAVEKRRGIVGEAVYGETLAANVHDITANLKTVTESIRQGKGTMGKLVMNDTLYTNLISFTARADSLLGMAADDSSNVSRLIRDKEFFNRIANLMKDLNLLLVDLKENPGRYVKVSVF